MIDLTNAKFGYLTVVKKFKKSSWVCKCRCGNTIVVTTSCLLSKHTRSCGCLYRKSYKQAHEKLKGIAQTEDFKNKLKLIKYSNKKPTKANKTSTRKGVCFSKSAGKFIAYINKNGKKIYLGFYKNEADAIAAREKAEKNIFKEICQKK